MVHISKGFIRTRFGRSKFRENTELVPLLDKDLSVDCSAWPPPADTSHPPGSTSPAISSPPSPLIPASPPSTPRLLIQTSPSADQPSELRAPPVVNEVVYSGEVHGARVIYSFDDPQFCDVVVIASGGRRFHCSRLFLCMHSAAFRTILAFKEGECRHSTVNVTEVDPNALGEALRFLHLGDCCINEANLVPLIKISKIYEIPALEETCRQYQSDSLCCTLENCCLLLQEALESGLLGSDLVWRCERFVASHLKELFVNDDFLNLPLAAVKAISNAAQYLLKDQPQYAHVLRGVAAWVAKDPGGRGVFADELIEPISVVHLSQSSILEISAAKAVLENPEIASALGKLFRRKTGNEASPALIAANEGNSNVVQKVIRRDGWCYIWGVGGMATHGEGKGAFKNVAMLGGAFNLRAGDVLKLAVTSPQSDVWTAAVVLTKRKEHANDMCLPHILLLAGGFVENLTKAVEDEDVSWLGGIDCSSPGTVLLKLSLLAARQGSFLSQSAENVLHRQCKKDSKGPCLKIWASYNPPNLL